MTLVWSFIAHLLLNVNYHIVFSRAQIKLQWRHNGRDGVSNHQPHDCLLNRLFRSRSQKTSKLRVTSLCAGNSPGTGEFPAQMTSYAENVSIWWRHHELPVVLIPVDGVTVVLIPVDEATFNERTFDRRCKCWPCVTQWRRGWRFGCALFCEFHMINVF